MTVIEYRIPRGQDTWFLPGCLDAVVGKTVPMSGAGERVLAPVTAVRYEGGDAFMTLEVPEGPLAALIAAGGTAGLSVDPEG